MAARKKATKKWSLPASQFAAARDAVGYLNFSEGAAEPQFLRNINAIWSSLPPLEDRRKLLKTTLLEVIDRLAREQPAFADCMQARTVVELGLDRLFHAYRDFHSDLLAHVPASDYDHPFFFAHLMEVVVSVGGPWDEHDRIIDESLAVINDYVGYRPVAVLENGRKSNVYSHERFCPIPIYTSGAGIAGGRYHDLIEHTFQFLRDAPQDILHAAYFDMDRLEELVVDQRAYDHLAPVNKRTNYLFGEWDPHRINNKGYYTRFVVREIILESLQDWIDDKKLRTPRKERLFDAAAALCGTMLMASSVSGSGPSTHDSTTSLTTLLPIVARRRDEFYERVMHAAQGDRLQRLQREHRRTQQPFGHVRQYLNMRLAGHGARQMQHRELAHLYAIMGYPQASREQAQAIPAPSIRLETEIECSLSAAQLALDHGDVEAAFPHVAQVPELMRRGIQCGAFVDPWNILGFHGQFPLFSSREDAIPDNRVEEMLSLMEQFFSTITRCAGEAAAKGLGGLREQISQLHQSVANWWDQFGSDIIEDLPEVSGQDSWEAATHVSSALAEWRQAGHSAGDISFWRAHVEMFQSAHSYALVVDALLQKQDRVAARGLLMQWLSQLEEVGFEGAQHSIFSMLIRWMKLAAAATDDSGSLTGIRRMFDSLEANAEEWWSVPRLGNVVGSSQNPMTDGLEFGGPDEMEEFSDEDDLFSAAYDDVVFRDSAADGNWGDTADDNAALDTEFEALNRELEPRLKFLNAVGQMWQIAAARFAPDLHSGSHDWANDEAFVDSIVSWHRQAQRWQIDLAELMESVWDHEISESSGDHDSNVEYDIQLQVKYFLLHQIISTLICLRNAERFLNGIIPEGVDVPRGTDQDRQLARLYRAVIQRDVESVRTLLPPLLSRLSRNPLLYIPLENGGEPGQILRIQALQSVIRFLLRELPRLGLLRETWHALNTAFRMERKWRPKGQAITEFDRLFAIALKTSLEEFVLSVRSWSPDKIDTEELMDGLARVLDPYHALWLEHSRTMRISAVDAIRKSEEWDELAGFIQRYGHDLFHASQLTLGNVRAILHNGVDWFLDYLQEEQDPLHPLRLLDDLDSGIVDRDEAEWCLEQVYTIIVDRFDRFLEYNTTTTQSDYGDMIYCLLDFLRLEARYDRDAWNLTPHMIVHEVLVRNGLLAAAEVREAAFEILTAELADRHLSDLHRLQKKYGMRMPTVTDHLNERFVKPMAVNRILALVEPAVNDARAGRQNTSSAFASLHQAVEEYLEDSWGSGIDVPDWLRSLEREVVHAVHPDEGGRPGMEAEFDVAPLMMSRESFLAQAKSWREPLTPRHRPAGPSDSQSDTGSNKPGRPDDPGSGTT